MNVDHFGDIILAEPIIEHRMNARRCIGIIIRLHSNCNILAGPWEWICFGQMRMETNEYWTFQQIVADVIRYLYSGNGHAWIDSLWRVKRPNRQVHCSIAARECVCVCEWMNRKLHKTGKLCCYLFMHLQRLSFDWPNRNPAIDPMQPYYVSHCAHRVSFVCRHRLSVTIHRRRPPIHLHLQCMHDRIAAQNWKWKMC